MSALAPTLQAFFTERLIRQRQVSAHTIASYRDTLRLLLIPYGGSAVKSAELTLRLATEDTDVLERQGHYSMAMVCRRSSVSTSFMLAALRVLHVDISNALGTGSLDRAKAICASEFACVGSVVLSAYIFGSWFLDLFRGRVGRSSGGGGRLGYGRLFGLAGPVWTF